MTEWIKSRLVLLIRRERSSHWLALSFSVGVYIAFSPFIGCHTLMDLGAIYLLNLNGPAVFTSSILINNPWTMVPVYSIDYLFGDWLCTQVFSTNFVVLNPWWMKWLNGPLTTYLALPELSLWSFFVGGNVLGVIAAFIAYPIMRYIFGRLIAMDVISS